MNKEQRKFMLKCTLFFSVLLCYSCKSEEKKQENDLKEMNLLGDVQIVKQLNYLYQANNSTPTFLGTYELVFNEAGNVEQKTTLNASNKELERVVAKYSPEGYKIEEITYDSNNVVGKNQTFKTQEYSDKIVTEASLNGKTVSTLKKYYDTKGRMSKYMKYDYENGDTSAYQVEYNYNELGKKVSQIQSGLRFSYRIIDTFLYNSKNELIEKRSQNPDKVETYENGNTKSVKSPNQYEVMDYRYDSKGNWIELNCLQGCEGDFKPVIKRTIKYRN